MGEPGEISGRFLVRGKILYPDYATFNPLITLKID